MGHEALSQVGYNLFYDILIHLLLGLLILISFLAGVLILPRTQLADLCLITVFLEEALMLIYCFTEVDF